MSYGIPAEASDIPGRFATFGRPPNAVGDGLGGALPWNGTSWTGFAAAGARAAPVSALFNAVAASGVNNVWITGMCYDNAW